MEYAFKKDGARFDFFLHEIAEDQLRCTFFNTSPRPGDAERVELISQVPRYHLAPMEFLNRGWLKPAHHESFLAAVCGDWRTPMPNFDHRNDDRSVVLIRWQRDF